MVKVIVNLLIKEFFNSTFNKTRKEIFWFQNVGEIINNKFDLNLDGFINVDDDIISCKFEKLLTEKARLVFGASKICSMYKLLINGYSGSWKYLDYSNELGQPICTRSYLSKFILAFKCEKFCLQENMKSICRWIKAQEWA